MGVSHLHTALGSNCDNEKPISWEECNSELPIQCTILLLSLKRYLHGTDAGGGSSGNVSIQALRLPICQTNVTH